MIDYRKRPKGEPEPEPAAETPAPQPDAKILVLRGENGEMVTAPANEETTARARAGAKHRKAIFEHRLEGAKARAGKLPRLLTGSLAAGATNLMLAKLLQEELQPATAKEAAEVAKITHAIYREASGQTAGNLNLTPAERSQRMAEVEELDKELRKRAEEANAKLGGAADLDDPPEPAPAPADDTVWEHDSETG